jgi:hypothetical protein
MDDAAFWTIISHVHAMSDGDMDRKCARLTQQLSGLPKEDALDFARLFDEKMNRAYDWSLWGAAYIINGGCSDDTFSDFRSSLISRGREAYEQALSNPESLTDDEIDPDIWFYEGFQYAVTDGVKAAAGLRPHVATPDQPSGEAWGEDAVYALYPRLSAKFT